MIHQFILPFNLLLHCYCIVNWHIISKSFYFLFFNSVKHNPEYRLLSPLQDYEEKRWMPSDNAAANVLLFYSYVPGDSPQMQEWNRAAQMMLQP